MFLNVLFLDGDGAVWACVGLFYSTCSGRFCACKIDFPPFLFSPFFSFLLLLSSFIPWS